MSAVDELLAAAVAEVGQARAARVAHRWLHEAAARAGLEESLRVVPLPRPPVEYPDGPVPPHAWVYFLQRSDTGNVKIGVAGTGAKPELYDIYARRARILTALPLGVDLTLLAAQRGGKELEERLHYRFAEWWVEREWFQPAPELLGYADRLADRLAADTSWHRTRWAHLLAHYPWFRREQMVDAWRLASPR